jgi:hypothetical protein
MFKISALFVLLSVGAYAGPITWTLQGITFADGGTASGSFAYDATANVYSAINITTTTGSQITGATYSFLDPANIPFDGPSELFVVTSNAANLSGTPLLDFYWSPVLTNAGGTDNPVTLGSAEGMCTSATCSTVNQSPSSYRIMTGGSVTTTPTATPEPATFLLVGCALGFLEYRRRSFTFGSRR